MRRLCKQRPARLPWVGVAGIAMFNIGDEGDANTRVSFTQLGVGKASRVRDLWARRNIADSEVRNSLTATLKAHPSAFHLVQ